MRVIDPTGEDPRPAGRAGGGPTPRDLASPTAIVCAVSAALAGVARAQPEEPAPDPAPDAGAPAPPDPREAKRWLDAGDTLMKAGDKLARRGKTDEATSEYERALISYQKAQEISG